MRTGLEYQSSSFWFGLSAMPFNFLMPLQGFLKLTRHTYAILIRFSRQFWRNIRYIDPVTTWCLCALECLLRANANTPALQIAEEDIVYATSNSGFRFRIVPRQFGVVPRFTK